MEAGGRAASMLALPETGTVLSHFRDIIGHEMQFLTVGKVMARPLLRLFAMKKFKPVHFVLISLVTLFLASCATQPQATSTTSNSPMNRDNNNGLASFLH